MTSKQSNNCSIYHLYNVICSETYDKIVIDTRKENEYHKLHIINSVNINDDLLDNSDLETILKSKGIRIWSIQSIYIYGNDQNKSSKLRNEVSKINVTDEIYVMDAGFNAFHHKFPFLCIDDKDQTTIKTIHYPSQIIIDKLFIGNMECANNTYFKCNCRYSMLSSRR